LNNWLYYILPPIIYCLKLMATCLFRGA